MTYGAVWKIFWTICAGWFIILIFRPKSIEEFKLSEQIKKRNRKKQYESLGLWIIGILIFIILAITYYALTKGSYLFPFNLLIDF